MNEVQGDVQTIESFVGNCYEGREQLLGIIGFA
jgi:hypothetical protein